MRKAPSAKIKALIAECHEYLCELGFVEVVNPFPPKNGVGKLYHFPYNETSFIELSTGMHDTGEFGVAVDYLDFSDYNTYFTIDKFDVPCVKCRKSIMRTFVVNLLSDLDFIIKSSYNLRHIKPNTYLFQELKRLKQLDFRFEFLF